MVAGGDSTSEIARSMSLTRRTVQTYISHILAKLGAKGRVDIVREAVRQGVPLKGVTRDLSSNDDCLPSAQPVP
jgi:hypothetical protein